MRALRAPEPMAAQSQQRDGGEQEHALDNGAELAPTVRSPRKSAAIATPGMVRVPSVATTIPV